MTQRNLTNKIRNAAKQASFRYSFESKSGRDFMQGFEEGATWYKDNHDPWFYVGDGELPELTKVTEEFYNSYDIIFIVEPDDCTITGKYVAESDNSGEFDIKFMDFEGNDFDQNDVKRWMPIPQPQK